MQNYFLYIDECGDHNLSNYDEHFPIFTLCGIIVSEDKRKWLENEILRLKQDFFGNQHTILHSRDIRKCQCGFEILFDLGIKKKFYERINRILGTKDIYVIVACSIMKEPYIRNYGRLNDVYAQSLSFVLERSVFYLDEINNDEKIELHTIVEMRGKKEDERLRTFYLQLIEKGTYWITSERLKNYVKSFTLLPKKANVIGLQVADLVAYPITRYLLNSDEPNMAYNIIKENIYHKGDKQLGIKIIPHK